MLTPKQHSTILQYLLIAFGGGIGSVMRYALGGWVQINSGSVFPWGTLAVNVLGCLAIGFLGALSLSEPRRMFLMIGVLGGFTTFSTFGFETFRLLNERDFVRAAANVLLSVGVGLAAVWIGFRLAQKIYGVWP